MGISDWGGFKKFKGPRGRLSIVGGGLSGSSFMIVIGAVYGGFGWPGRGLSSVRVG